jgi:hypothetical protein
MAHHRHLTTNQWQSLRILENPRLSQVINSAYFGYFLMFYCDIENWDENGITAKGREAFQKTYQEISWTPK